MTTEVLLLPVVLRVLAIDDDQIYLEAVGAMLESCKYQVTKCRSGEEALLLLKDDNIINRFDIILTNLHMPDVNGIKLLDIIQGLELDVPVVIMSSDESRESVMEAIVHGACDYIIKPVAMETIQLLWQHVVRKRRVINNGDAADDGVESISTGVDEAGSGRSSITKKRNRSESSSDQHHHQQGESSWKKPRMVWTPTLHQQFVDAVNQLGYSNAVPKKIIKVMNIPGLTRGIVASHLQKYRNQLRRQFEDSRRDEVVPVPAQGPSTGAFNGGDPRNYLLEEYGGYVLPAPVSGAMMETAQTPYLPLPSTTVTDDHHQPEYYLSNQLTAGGPPEIQPIQNCGGVSSSLGSTDAEYGCYIADHHQPGNTSRFLLNNSIGLYNHHDHHQSIPSMGCESFSFDEIYEQSLRYQH